MPVLECEKAFFFFFFLISKVADDPNFFLRKFVQFNLVLWWSYVQNYVNRLVWTSILMKSTRSSYTCVGTLWETFAILTWLLLRCALRQSHLKGNCTPPPPPKKKIIISDLVGSMVKVRGQISNRNMVKQTAKMAQNCRVTNTRSVLRYWCQAARMWGCGMDLNSTRNNRFVMACCLEVISADHEPILNRSCDLA